MTDKAVVNVEKTITLRTKEQFVIRKDRIKQKVLEEEEYLSVRDLTTLYHMMHHGAMLHAFPLCFDL